MKQDFLNYVAKNNFFESNQKVLLAVSGGIDSMVMLHLFQACGFNIAVAHANFQLRGNESEGDEKFVEEICKKNAIPFFAEKFETETFAKGNHLSIQMAARKLRYQWFDGLLAPNHFHFVATAHHVNDAIETMLLNFARGTGLEGLDGIASKNGTVIRPLLFATRAEIENYARENKLEWREDRSNATDDYARNFIRHRIYPLLKELNPSLEKTFGESMDKIAGTVELSAAGVERWKEKFEHKNSDQIHLDKSGFDHLQNPEGVLWNLIKGLGFNFDQCRQVVTALHGQSGKRFSSSAFELVIDRDHLIISKIQPDLTETLIQADQAEASLGGFKMKIEKNKKTDFKNSPSVAFLDAGKLQFPLRWRKWKSGDAFYPLGMSHKKKISDFLIDQKISLTEKETVTVLESGDEIVWVVGLRINDYYKVSATTKFTLVCQLSAIC